MLKIFEIFDKYPENGEKMTFLMILDGCRGFFVTFVKLLYYTSWRYLRGLENRFWVSRGN